MAIDMKGLLDPSALDEIFRILANQENACSLLVSDGVSEKIFYFAIGGIRLVRLGGRKTASFGELLVELGRLTPDKCEVVAAAIGASGKRFGDVALEMGYVQRADLEAAIRLQMEYELCDLFLWPHAEYEFREGQPPTQFYDQRYLACAISIDVPEFIDGVLARRQRLEEIRARIPSDREVFEPTVKGKGVQAVNAEDALHRVLALVDGTRRVSDLVEKTGFAALVVYEALSKLLDEGMVALRRDEFASRLAREEILAEIAKLEKARSEVMGDLILLTRLARAYEEVGENARAASIWKEIAKAHRRKNDLRQALDALRAAVRCVPEDFNAWDQILDIHRQTKDFGKLAEEGRALAETLLKNNLLNRARHLLGTLTSLSPREPRLRKLYALTLLGLGETSLALFQLKELAGILERDNPKSLELREVYRRILALDKGDKDVRRKLLVLSGGNRAMWISRIVVAAAVLALLASGVAFFYERSARDSYTEQGIDLERLLFENDFAAARKSVERVREEYPLSSAARSASDWLARIDRYEADYLRERLEVELRLARRARAAGDLAEAMKYYQRFARLDRGAGGVAADAVDEAQRFLNAEEEARSRVEKGRVAADMGEVENALRIYHDVRGAYPGTKAVREINWPVRVSSWPPGATVYVNGVETGKAEPPLLVYYSLGVKTRIELELAGFETARIDVTEPLGDKLVAKLRRRLEWTYRADGPFESSPVVDGDTIYLTGRDRYLYAIDAAEGRRRFRTPLGIFGDCSAAPAVLGGIVVVGTGRGELLGVDGGLGTVLWRRDAGSPVIADLRADPEANCVYVSVADGRVLALDPVDGDEKWGVGVRAAPSSGPAAAESLVFVGSYDRRRLVAIDARAGEERWDVPAGGPVAASPAVDGDMVCFGADDQHFYAVRRSDPTVVTRQRVNGMVKARAALESGTAWFGTLDGNFYCLPLAAGPEAGWKRQLGDPVLGEAALGEGRVYVGTTGGDLYCLDRKTGAVQWIFEAGAKLVAKPLLAGGKIYLATMDGHLYAIRE